MSICASHIHSCAGSIVYSIFIQAVKVVCSFLQSPHVPFQPVTTLTSTSPVSLFSLFRANSSTFRDPSSSFCLSRLMFGGSAAADSSCMSQFKNSRCHRSRQARWGLRRQWYLPTWHKRELSPMIDDVTGDAVFLRFIVLLTLSPQKPFLLSFISTALHTVATATIAHF